MGHFVAQVKQRLLADHFGDNQALGLVGHHVIREILGAHGQFLRHDAGQLLQAVAGFGADGDDGIVAAVCKGRDQGQQLFGLQQVDLVQQQDLRHLLGRHFLDDGAVMLADCSSVHQHHHAVHAIHRFADGLHHVVAQLGAGGVDAGGIQEHHLPVITGHNAHDAVAGGLGAVGDDGDLLADEGVHQRGLAHIGTANDGHKTGTELLCFSHFR